MNPYTALLTTVRQRLLENATLAPIPLVIEHEGRAIAIAERNRSAHTTTLVTAAPHGLKNLSRARIELMSAADYNADNVVITVVDATTFSYANVGADEIDIPETEGIVTPLLVPIESAIEFSLVKGGLLRGATNKGGMAILLMALKGRPASAGVGNRNVSPQTTLLRIAIFIKPLFNSASTGLQLQPMDVLTEVERQILSWTRGNLIPNTFTNWESFEAPGGEMNYAADFEIPVFLNLN